MHCIALVNGSKRHQALEPRCEHVDEAGFHGKVEDSGDQESHRHHGAQLWELTFSLSTFSRTI